MKTLNEYMAGLSAEWSGTSPSEKVIMIGLCLVILLAGYLCIRLAPDRQSYGGLLLPPNLPEWKLQAVAELQKVTAELSRDEICGRCQLSRISTTLNKVKASLDRERRNEVAALPKRIAPRPEPSASIPASAAAAVSPASVPVARQFRPPSPRVKTADLKIFNPSDLGPVYSPTSIEKQSATVVDMTQPFN